MGRYVPDPPEDFDEFEFETNFGGIANLGLMVTVEKMAIKRIFFGVFSQKDPDVVTGLDEAQLERVFHRSGAQVNRFFDYITKKIRAV